MSDSLNLSGLVLQFHPMMENVVINWDNDQMTEAQVLDRYASAVEKRYGCQEGTIRSTCTHLIPFVPIYPTTIRMTICHSVTTG